MSNRTIVENLIRLVFEANDLDAAFELLHEDFISHNPLVAHDPVVMSGPEAFIAFFRTPAGEALMKADTEVRRVVADGELVAVHSRITRPEAAAVAVVDILRVLDGRVVEHWDVVQPIPEAAANPHGMV
jgi:predicted SnoaL-like aldol condensation-catalyzing enzyme